MHITNNFRRTLTLWWTGKRTFKQALDFAWNVLGSSWYLCNLLKIFGFGKRLHTPSNQSLVDPPEKPVLCQWHQHLPMEISYMIHVHDYSRSWLLHERIIKKAKRSLKENIFVVLKSFITKGSWTIVKKREEKWI